MCSTEEMIMNGMNGLGKTKKASTENILDAGECYERVTYLFGDQAEQPENGQKWNQAEQEGGQAEQMPALDEHKPEHAEQKLSQAEQEWDRDEHRQGQAEKLS
jgi:hypothetical protein